MKVPLATQSDNLERMHNAELILTLTAGLGAALLFGFLALRLKLPPIVGYLVAGLLLGPHTPGFVANRGLADQLAEIGVILLMFGVGLHFHVRDLLAVRRIAITGALVQIVFATTLGALAGRALGWSWSAGIIFGIALSVASTVVLIRVLTDSGDLQSRSGRIAIGWLVVEDLFTVFVLVVLPSVLGAEDNDISLGAALALTALRLIALSVLILWGGGRVLPAILAAAAKTRSRELFTLTVLVIALGIALGSAKIFGVSMALGAFLAGMVVGQSEFSNRAASEALPMRDAFAVLFFVSVGMLFNPAYVLRAPVLTAVAITIVLLAKPLAAFVIVTVLGFGARSGFRVAVALAQVGEFSFILASLGDQLGILPLGATHALIAASIVSITLNPLLYRAIPIIERKLRRSSAWTRTPSDQVSETADVGHRAVVVGYGPVGKTLSTLLREQGITPTIIELNIETMRQLEADGFRGVHDDAGRAEALSKAGIATASALIISAPGAAGSAELIRRAREMNPRIRVLARAAFLSNAEALRAAGADEVFSGEAEVAMAMIESVLLDLGSTPEQRDSERDRARTRLYSGAQPS